MKTTKNVLSIIALISILTLTFNVLLVQAGPPSITLILSGEGNVEVTGITGKGKEIDLGSYPAPNPNIKITGNVDYVVFTLIPKAEPPYHVSAIVQDGNYIPFGNVNLVDLGDGSYNYTLNMELKQHTLEVTFSPEGEAIVPPNTAATVFLGSTASIFFDNTGNDGILIFSGLELKDFPDSLTVWDITTDADGEVIVTLLFTSIGDDEANEAVRLYSSDLEYPNADVYPIITDDDGEVVQIGDNQITTDDVKAVSAVNPGTVPGDQDWDSILDINGDGVIDGTDVSIVAGYHPLLNPPGVWEDITIDPPVEIGNTGVWMVSGIATHFSLFRCR